MSESAEVKVLRMEIEKGMAVLDRLGAFFRSYVTDQLDANARRPEQAMVIVQSVANYYTCLETMFLRISQFFENSLAADRWHQDLLGKMTLRVEGIREAAIGETTFQGLSELLKFRHFTRYYFEFDYDWERLLYIKDRCLGVMPLVDVDMKRFLAFLREME